MSELRPQYLYPFTVSYIMNMLHKQNGIIVLAQD